MRVSLRALVQSVRSDVPRRIGTVRRMQAAASSGKNELLPLGLLVCDYDDTLTAQDTISVIFEVAAEAHRQQHGADASLKIKRLASSLGEGYLEQYNAFNAEQLPKLGQSVTYNRVGVLAFLAELSAFDRDMVGVVEDSQVLRGIPTGALEAAGREKVRLKSGSKEVLQKALRAGVATHICSVNWSQEMVRGTLNAAATAEGSLAEVEIHCNNLAEEGARSTGRIARSIVCAADKAEVVQRLLRQNPGCSVMCGDSLSDLQALLAVDFGIVIGSSSSLRRVMNAAGISRQPLSQVRRDVVGPRGTLLHVEDWGEIDAFLFPKSS